MVNPNSAHLCDLRRDEIEEEADGKDQLNCPCVCGYPAADAALNHQTTNQPTALR